MAIDLYKNRCSVYEGEKPYIFISYSHRDIEKVVALIRKLSLLGFRIWYDSGVPAGSEWDEEIAKHLKKSKCVLSLLTPNSVKSKHFKREFNYADYLEKDILAVYLEECEPSPGLEMQVVSKQCIKREHCENDDDLLEEIARAQILLPCLDEKPEAKPETPAPAPAPQPEHKTPKTKIDKLREKAEKGDAQAQADLGWAYEKGNDVKQNFQEAVKWYQRAAEQGHSWAQNAIGLCYDRGNGVQQSYTEAVKWYRRAANQQYDWGQYNLGVCYDFGRGVDQNYSEAIIWYQKAADQGHLGALNNLAVFYDNGFGVEKDWTKALSLFRNAAEQGHGLAQQNLGKCYEFSKGTPQDWEQAVYWYRKAANQGQLYSQKKLAECYRKGLGVPVDEAEANHWQELYEKNTNK